jgi:thiamine kinase-like enzyme
MIAPNLSNPSEAWRILIVRRDCDEILVEASGSKYTLPQVDIPAQQRIAAHINRTVERDFGLRVISLYEVAPDAPERVNGVPYHAAATIQDTHPPQAGNRWICARSLTADSFSRDGDFAALRAFRSRLDAARQDGTSGPFLKPDWFAEVTNWVKNSIRSHSSHLTGAFQQLNACATFSLIRFETGEKPVWFKAVGEPNLREYAVTLALAHACPAFVPHVLASENKWNAWLTTQAPGQSLASARGILFWETTAATLASLQIAMLNDTEVLLRAGARDLSVSALRAALDPFFEWLADAVVRSRDRYFEDLTPCDVSELRDVVRGALETFLQVSAIDSIGHMDLSPGNILCTTDRATFLDWAEAFVGAPVFSFEYLLQHFRRAFPHQQLLEERFRNAYLEPWRMVRREESVETSLSLSPLLALFAYATTVWSSATWGDAQDPGREKYLSLLVRKLRSEAAKTNQQRGSR